MKHCAFVVGILALALPFASIVFGKDKPEKGALPLGADEVAIYKALLTKYVSGEPGSLNVSVKTYPLDPEANMNGLKNGGCLKGIELDNLSLVSHTYHELTPDVLPGKNVRLVDPHKQAKVVRGNDPDKTMRKGKSVDSAVNEAFASALFSMSEIAFDKNHRYAMVSYHFWCGSLCGNGSTLVFEKVGDQWRKTDRNCGGWVS